MTLQKNGAKLITEKIQEAIQSGFRRVEISGYYEIEETVVIPSNFTLNFKDAYLVMADDTFCNMFTNEHSYTEEGRTLQGTDNNIRILGEGQVIFDGGNYNNLSERNALKNGMPPIYRNALLLFANVDGFEISGIKVQNQRWWGLAFVYARNGKIRDVAFQSNSTTLLPDGTTTFVLPKYEDYECVLVKNADGIDVRQGCHNILIENITGFCEDDSVALTVANGGLERMFAVSGMSHDIRNVIVRNVFTSAYCNNVRLLLKDPNAKLYNILIDGVMDVADDCPYMSDNSAGASVVLGWWKNGYASYTPTQEQFYNITVRNVYSSKKCAVRYFGEIGELTLDAIKGFSICKKLIDHITFDND